MAPEDDTKAGPSGTKASTSEANANTVDADVRDMLQRGDSVKADVIRAYLEVRNKAIDSVSRALNNACKESKDSAQEGYKRHFDWPLKGAITKGGSSQSGSNRGRKCLSEKERGDLWDAISTPNAKVSEVAKQLGLSQVTVWKWMKRYEAGETKADFMRPVNRGRRLTEGEKTTMVEALKDPKLSVTDVAQQIGVSYTTAWKWKDKVRRETAPKPGGGFRQHIMHLPLHKAKLRLPSARIPAKAGQSLRDQYLTEVSRELDVSLSEVMRWSNQSEAGASDPRGPSSSTSPRAESTYPSEQITKDEKNLLWDALAKPGVDITMIAKSLGIEENPQGDSASGSPPK